MRYRPRLAGGLLALLLALPLAAQQGRPPPAVIAVEAASERIVDHIEALGTVRANESVRVAAKTTEKIVALHFDDGQRVAAGELLVTLDDAEEQAELRAAEARREERRNAFERAAELATKNAGAKAARDDARALLLGAEADIEAIRVRLAEHRIRAPFAGVVGLRDVSVGALVGPGTVLATLDDLEVVKLDFSVTASFIDVLRPGLAVEATTSAYPGRLFAGEVRSIDTRVDPVTRSVQVRATIDNAGRALLPGMLMQLDLASRPRDALVVPEVALVPQGGQQYVFVIDTARGNRVERREVRIGTRVAGRVEIVAGLEAGELIVEHGTINVRPGQPVTVRAVDDGTRSVREMLAAPAGTGTP